MFEVDVLRNTALADPETYDDQSDPKAKFDLLNRVKAACSTMPLLTEFLARKFASRQGELLRKSIADSIIGKILAEKKDESNGPAQMDIEGMIKYAKTQKKGNYYGDTLLPSVLVPSSIPLILRCTNLTSLGSLFSQLVQGIIPPFDKTDVTHCIK